MRILKINLKSIAFDTYFQTCPDSNGYFGKYSGSYITHELHHAMNNINNSYHTLSKSSKFVNELIRIYTEFQGRPTLIKYSKSPSKKMGTDANLYSNREDLNQTGAHKLNHYISERLLAKYIGKKKVIAETEGGHYDVALATATAYFGLECDVYTGAWIFKKAPNVAQMKILGAKVTEVKAGLKTLKGAIDAAFVTYC